MKPPRMLMWFLLSCALSAATVAAEYQIRERPREGKVADLPAAVRPSAGRLSFVADFADEKEGAVWLYLINATQEMVALPAQDGDVYAKRESRTGNGNWMRCDEHRFSDCGNSYMGGAKIPAGHFRAWRQRLHSKAGEIKPVRFRLYNLQEPALISNEGNAKVDPMDIERCRFDPMGIATGPFEDVAAVALGKAPVPAEDDLDSFRQSTRALERFFRDPRLFDTLVAVAKRVHDLNDTAIEGQKLGLQMTYEDILRALATKTADQLVEGEGRHWKFLNQQFQDRTNPWRGSALNSLISRYEWDTRRMLRLLEQTLDSPDDSAMHAALFGYPKFATKPATLARLSAIVKDERYSTRVRADARDALEGAFPNPFLKIETRQRNDSTMDRPTGLSYVRFTNISPQDIQLNCASAEELLVVRVTDEEGNDVPRRAPKEKKQPEGNQAATLSLKVGESVELKDVEWWKELDPDAEMKGEYLTVTFLAASPGLWSFPAGMGGASIFKTEIVKGLLKSTKAAEGR